MERGGREASVSTVAGLTRETVTGAVGEAAIEKALAHEHLYVDSAARPIRPI